MNENISFGIAFAAGIVSFLSPCVLPLIPGYFSFISGVSIDQMKDESSPAASKILTNAVFFVLGFTLVFVMLGASATGVGQFLVARLALFNKVAGALIVVLGIHMTGLIRWNVLLRQKTFAMRKKPLGLLGSLVVGMTFAFGWTPCIGPILAGILALASTEETVFKGMALLAVYSLGLGLPFLLAALSVGQFFKWSAKIKKQMHAIEVGSGILLIFVGVLIFTGRLTMLANYFPFLNRFSM